MFCVRLSWIEWETFDHLQRKWVFLYKKTQTINRAGDIIFPHLPPTSSYEQILLQQWMTKEHAFQCEIWNGIRSQKLHVDFNYCSIPFIFWDNTLRSIVKSWIVWTGNLNLERQSQSSAIKKLGCIIKQEGSNLGSF